MGQKSGSGSHARVPIEVDGINVNACANPSCKNFNTPALPSKDDNYAITGTGKGTSALFCKACKRHYSIKSNLAVVEELQRFRLASTNKKVFRQDGLCCHSTDCQNFGLFVSENPSLYKRKGTTSKGNQRYQCKFCGTTFTQGSKKRVNHPNAKNHQNANLFKLLVNQTGINRAMEITGLSPQAIYRKIDMFYERCNFFLQQREARLRHMEIPMMRLCSDRQEYQVNWSQRKDKRFVVISAIGTADKKSRYVFGMEVNFDESLNLNELAESGELESDRNLKAFNRKFARIWTHHDYAKASQVNSKYKSTIKQYVSDYLNNNNIPLSEASLAYIRDKIETEYGIPPIEIDFDSKLPLSGTLVHSEYTMYAHFYKLRELIGHADSLRFYLDQEQGINKACCLAFGDMISKSSCHVAYVGIDKELTVDQRRFRVATTKNVVEEMMKNGEALDEYHAHQILVRNSLQQPHFIRNVKDPWYFIPVHKIYECDKFVCPLTDISSMQMYDQIKFHLDASLHPIDNFFQIVRRRLSLLERPVHTQSNTGLVWTGKSPYKPEMVNKLLQILRTYFNYCYISKIDGKTPAQRLGLAKGVVEIRKILY